MFVGGFLACGAMTFVAMLGMGMIAEPLGTAMFGPYGGIFLLAISPGLRCPDLQRDPLGVHAEAESTFRHRGGHGRRVGVSGCGRVFYDVLGGQVMEKMVIEV